jgi:demethoxyubiquinone hydroxylase (CLK1/Coq7/Cat5 family)
MREELVKDSKLTENELWMASFYRSSEMNGAMFFGRVARTVRGPLQKDLTHHYADESAHAYYWTECIDAMDQRAIPMRDAYQDRYLDAVGVPSNLMEVMAITQILEKRTIGHYNQHLRRETTPEPVKATIEKIMRDERWHIQYVRDALLGMEERYGAEEIESTLARYTAADIEVYAEAMAEYDERMTEYAERHKVSQ